MIATFGCIEGPGKNGMLMILIWQSLLAPVNMMRKRKAIFKHQSQKDRPLFPGNDAREFWQRAEDRNSGTAEMYDQLGLPEYEAIEAFKRYHFL